MFSKKLAPVTLGALISIVLITMGCDTDSNYNQRTVVYVSSINNGQPYMSDVLNQGEELYYEGTTNYNFDDDYVAEDAVVVEIHNRPSTTIIAPETGALGDFLVTDYSVEYTVTYSTIPGIATPVPAFSGKLSELIPLEKMVEVVIPIVPFYVKTTDPLAQMYYSANEIMTYATITLSGHYVQTDQNVSFTAGLTVNFADPLTEDDAQ